MKEYWSIPGWRAAPLGLPCIAFEKPDGSNIRAEWSKKTGWYKFGSRTVLLDESHPDLGGAIPLFMRTMAEPLERVFSDLRKKLPFDHCLVFMEYLGPGSFAGLHVKGEPKELKLFDVNPLKRGFMAPRDFLKWFGGLPTPKVVYEGNFNASFIRDVREGKYGDNEGVVAKGTKATSRPPHNIWMAKAKTQWWLDKLKERVKIDPRLQRVLEENLREQIDV